MTLWAWPNIQRQSLGCIFNLKTHRDMHRHVTLLIHYNKEKTWFFLHSDSSFAFCTPSVQFCSSFLFFSFVLIFIFLHFYSVSSCPRVFLFFLSCLVQLCFMLFCLVFLYHFFIFLLQIQSSGQDDAGEVGLLRLSFLCFCFLS